MGYFRFCVKRRGKTKKNMLKGDTNIILGDKSIILEKKIYFFAIFKVIFKKFGGRKPTRGSALHDKKGVTERARGYISSMTASVFPTFQLLHTCRPKPHILHRTRGSTSRRRLTLAVVAASHSMEAEGKNDGALKKGIAEFYDESSGTWENIWGDHMHHGFYDPDSTVSVSDHRAAQIRMIDEALRFAGLSGRLLSHSHLIKTSVLRLL